MSVRSMSANRSVERNKDFMTPQRLNPNSNRKSVFASENKGSRMSGRGSAIGSKNVKDTRPLTDKIYQQTQVRKILDFLRENQYRNDALTSKHFPLSTKEFTNIFNFAYSFINPSEAEVLPQGRAEDIIIDILKNLLNYPGTVNKSNFVTMGSLHSWPTVLGCLSFICETAKIYSKMELNVVPIAFPSNDDQGFPTDRESKEKVQIEHFVNCYNLFNEGCDDFDAEREVFQERLFENSGVDLHHINALEEEYQYLENKLQEQRQHPDTRDGLKEQLDKKEADLIKISDYAIRVSNKKDEIKKREEQLTEMNAEVESRLHEKEADLLALKEENSKGPSLQMNSQLEVDKRLRLLQTKEDVKSLQNEKWQIEVQFYRLLDSIEKIALNFNSVCMEIGLKNTTGENFLTLPLPDRGSGGNSVTISDEIPQIQMKMADLLREVRQKNQQASQELAQMEQNLQTTRERAKAAGFKANEYSNEHTAVEQRLQGCKEAIEKEEAALDQNLREMKVQLTRLREDDQNELGERVAVLDEKERRLSTLTEFKAQREVDCKQFLEEVSKKSVRYIQRMTQIRDEAREKVRRNKRARQLAIKKAMEEIEAVDAELAKKMQKLQPNTE